MKKLFLVVLLALAAQAANAQSFGQSWFYGGASSSASANISNQATYGVPTNTNGATNGLNAIICTPPSVNGVYNLLYNITGSAAAQASCPLAGIVMDQAAGTTVLYSDNQNIQYNPAAALSLPTPTSLGNPNFFSTFIISRATTPTITPVTWTCSLNGATAGSTCTPPAHSKASLLIDQVSSTQWDIDSVDESGFIEGAAIPASAAMLGTNSSKQLTAPTSLILTGIIDGAAPVTITTGTSATLGAGTYSSGYTLNQEGTAGTGVTYTLPATVTGKQYCVANSGTTSVVNTGVLTVYPPASSYVILNGVVNTVGGGGTHGVASGGAAGDAACFVAIDSTHWQVWVGKGTWTEN